MNRMICKSTLVFALLISTSFVCATETIWTNLALWFRAAQQNNINTGLIQVIENIAHHGGCVGASCDDDVKSLAENVIAYMTTQESFSTDAAVLPFYRLLALKHFCPDFNVPLNQSTYNGTTAADALAFLTINQELNVEQATPYIKALLVAIQTGY